MRIYVPATLLLLQAALGNGQFTPVSGIGFAVTDDLRGHYLGADDEDLHYLAVVDAALASLRLISRSPVEPLRVVIVLDLPAAEVTRLEEDRAAVKLPGQIPWSAVVEVLMDGGEAAEIVRAAADVVHESDLGDPDAEITVGDAEDISLASYRPDEVKYLITQLGL